MLLRTCDFGGGSTTHCRQPVLYQVSGLDVPNGRRLDTCGYHTASAVAVLHVEASGSGERSEQLTLHFLDIAEADPQ